MDFELSKELMMIREGVKKFIERDVEPLSLEIEKKGVIPDKILNTMRELGLFGIAIPEEYGGLGLSMLGQCVVYEELGKTNACIRTYMGSNNGPGAECIIHNGNEEQRKKFLTSLACGEKIASTAMSEPDTGSDLSGIKTSATKEGDKFILNGNKTYITMGDVADINIVLAYTDKKLGVRKGLTLFIVEKEFPGFSIGTIDEKMGLRGSNTCELIFDNCIVPETNVIGEIGAGFEIILKGVNRGRIGISAVAIGSASKLLDLSIDYSKQREAFGRPIGQFQLIQGKLADMATNIYAARMMLYNAAWMVDQGQQVTKEAAMVKLFSTEMVNRVAYEALQIFGGIGYIKDLPIERISRDVRVLTIYEGTSEIQRLTIARQLVK
jgi:acyl-CoA dehydrogenase